MSRVSDQINRKLDLKKKKYFTPFIMYDFSQNRFSSSDNNLNDIISAIKYSSTEALKCANMQREFNSKITHAHVFVVLSMVEVIKKFSMVVIEHVENYKVVYRKRKNQIRK